MITSAAQLADTTTKVRDAEGGTWTRQPGSDVWQPDGAAAIDPISTTELLDLFRPLTPLR